MRAQVPDPIRVIHLINHLGYGGSERQLYLLLEHFDRSRFEHKVVVFNPSPERVYDDSLQALGVEVLTLPPRCRGIARRLLFLGRWMRRRRPHVVHSWTFHDNPYAGLAGRFAGAGVRWGSLRGSLHSEGLERQPAFLRRLMLQSVQRIVINSGALVEELVSAGVARRRVVLLPNCVRSCPDTESGIEPADLTDLGIDADMAVVGIVGNLRAVKNHRLFVQAMARVLPSRPRVRALIVGQAIPSEPAYRSEIEAEIERLGLRDRIVLAGFRDDIPALLKRFSILCLTSKSEGLPNAVLEAMAASRPVVACRVGGVPELVDDSVHGLLVEPEDAEGLATAVGRLLDHPDLAADMGRAGRRRATEELGCDVAAARLAEAYRSALGWTTEAGP